MKYVLLVICALLIGVGLAIVADACSDSSSKPRKTVASLSAAQLRQEYVDNEARADSKYKGKFVEISGTVEEIKSGGMFSDPYLALSAGSSINESLFRIETHTIPAYFDNESDLVDFDKGRNATLNCKVDGKSNGLFSGMTVKVENCVGSKQPAP